MTSNEFDVLDFPGADELRSAGDVTPPSAAAISAALGAVRAATADDEGTQVVTTMRPRRRTRRVLVSAAAVAAVAAGAAVYPAIGFGGHEPAATANAETFLHQVAHTAAGLQAPQAEYWKVRLTRVAPLPIEAKNLKVTPAKGSTGPMSQTLWLYRTGLRERTSDGSVVDIPAGKSKNALMSWDVANESITWDDLGTLPKDPDALKKRLLGKAGHDAEEGLFNGIDALLSRAPSSPELRASLYDVLAGIPGVRLAGDAKDSTGRTGTAVELVGGDRVSRLIIDPRSSLLLQTEVDVHGGPQDGSLVSRTTYDSAGPAKSAPAATRRFEPVPHVTKPFKAVPCPTGATCAP